MEIGFSKELIDSLASCVVAALQNGFGQFSTEFVNRSGQTKAVRFLVTADDFKSPALPPVGGPVRPKLEIVKREE